MLTARNIVERQEHSTAECRHRMIAPSRKRRFSPEVESVDVAVREIHGALMWFVAIFPRYVGYHRESARHNRALRAADWREVGLGDRCVEVVGGEGVSADAYVDAAVVAHEFHRFREVGGFR